MSSFQNRQAELQKNEASCIETFNTAMTRMRAEQAAVQTAHVKDLASLRTAAQGREDALQREVADTIHATLRPICVEARDDSRTGAKAFAVAYNALRDRCIDELGDQPNWRHIGLAMAAAYSLDSFAAAGSDAAWTSMGDTSFSAAAAAVEKACIEFPNGGAVVRNALEMLEAECERLTRRKDLPRLPERSAAMASVATNSAVRAALADFDSGEAAARREARANEAPSPNTRIH